MPRKNVIKTYIENGYYHLYNRGVDKRSIFTDDYDYATFLFYLKLYLSPPQLLQGGDKFHPILKKKIRLDIDNVTLFGQIFLLAYCLMPNHFHLLIKQRDEQALPKFTKRLLTAYSRVFNQRHHRQGPLFESNYKAVIVETDEQLLHLSRYIHRNPLPMMQNKPESLVAYPYSSLPQYLGRYRAPWLHTREVLDFFGKHTPSSSYKEFVEEKETEREVILLDPLILES